MSAYNFTEDVRRVLALAKDEAIRLRHEYVGTEHILLGLIGHGGGIAVSTLQNLGVNLGAIRQRIEDVVTMGKAESRNSSDLPYTSRAKKIIELSLTEARNLGHDYVDTEHLLLGILREEKGIAAQILVDAGLTEGTARAEVRRHLGAAGRREARLPASAIIAIAVEIRLANGSVVRGNFRSAEEVIGFLKQK